MGADPASAFLAGGTNEVDLIRAGISHSRHLVDINELPLNAVEDRSDGGLHIGALARMSDVARGPADSGDGYAPAGPAEERPWPFELDSVPPSRRNAVGRFSSEPL